MKKLSYVLALGCMMCTTYESHAAACKNTVVRCEKDGAVTFKGFPTTYYFLKGCFADNQNAIDKGVSECQQSGGMAEVIFPWSGEDWGSGVPAYQSTHPNATESEISLFKNALG